MDVYRPTELVPWESTQSIFVTKTGYGGAYSSLSYVVNDANTETGTTDQLRGGGYAKERVERNLSILANGVPSALRAFEPPIIVGTDSLKKTISWDLSSRTADGRPSVRSRPRPDPLPATIVPPGGGHRVSQYQRPSMARSAPLRGRSRTAFRITGGQRYRDLEIDPGREGGSSSERRERPAAVPLRVSWSHRDRR